MKLWKFRCVLGILMQSFSHFVFFIEVELVGLALLLFSLMEALPSKVTVGEYFGNFSCEFGVFLNAFCFISITKFG